MYGRTARSRPGPGPATGMNQGRMATRPDPAARVTVEVNGHTNIRGESMRKTMMIGLLVVLTWAFLSGCAPIPNVQTGWDYWPPDKIYTVFGQVRNFRHQPISDVDVVLIKRKQGEDPDKLSDNERAVYADEEEKSKLDHPIQAQFHVARSSQTGDYSFEFEPWKAYDLWLYFDASKQGYEPQMIMLNPYIRDIITRGPGKSPISLTVILEPIQDEEERDLLMSSD